MMMKAMAAMLKEVPQKQIPMRVLQNYLEQMNLAMMTKAMAAMLKEVPQKQIPMRVLRNYLEQMNLAKEVTIQMKIHLAMKKMMTQTKIHLAMKKMVTQTKAQLAMKKMIVRGVLQKLILVEIPCISWLLMSLEM